MKCSEPWSDRLKPACRSGCVCVCARARVPQTEMATRLALHSGACPNPAPSFLAFRPSEPRRSPKTGRREDLKAGRRNGDCRIWPTGGAVFREPSCHLCVLRELGLAANGKKNANTQPRKKGFSPGQKRESNLLSPKTVMHKRQETLGPHFNPQ